MIDAWYFQSIASSSVLKNVKHGRVEHIGRDEDAPYDPLWDDVNVKRFEDDKEAYSPLVSQGLLGVATDPPTAETVSRAMLAVTVSSERREEERYNNGHPCQGLPQQTPMDS